MCGASAAFKLTRGQLPPQFNNLKVGYDNNGDGDDGTFCYVYDTEAVSATILPNARKATGRA